MTAARQVKPMPIRRAADDPDPDWLAHVDAADVGGHEMPWTDEPTSAPRIRGRAEAAPPPPPPWLDRIAPCATEWFTTAPPRRDWLLRDARADDAGVLPLGKVALLTGEGGVSKTMVVIGLAISVASHEPIPWLGCFTIPNQGRALLLLGEEDAEEVHRRLYNARRASDAPVPEPGSIIVVPLAGIPVPMIETDERGNPLEGAFLVWLRTYVQEHGPFALVIVDPLSRFAGKDAEIDNAMATRFIQALESVATASGATVLCVHHTNKTAPASAGRAAVRGSSAIYDGVRWAAALSAERVEMDGSAAELVTLSVVKSNYSRMSDPVTLRRDHENGGALVPLTEMDRERVAQARAEADPSARKRAVREAERDARHEAVDAALRAVLTEQPGIGTRELRAALAARLGGCSAENVADALARAGETVRRETGPGRAVRHFLEVSP